MKYQLRGLNKSPGIILLFEEIYMHFYMRMYPDYTQDHLNTTTSRIRISVGSMIRITLN